MGIPNSIPRTGNCLFFFRSSLWAGILPLSPFIAYPAIPSSYLSTWNDTSPAGKDRFSHSFPTLPKSFLFVCVLSRLVAFRLFHPHSWGTQATTAHANLPTATVSRFPGQRGQGIFTPRRWTYGKNSFSFSKTIFARSPVHSFRAVFPCTFPGRTFRLIRGHPLKCPTVSFPAFASYSGGRFLFPSIFSHPKQYRTSYPVLYPVRDS